MKWDVKEIMSQHNIYVDALLKASILGNISVKDNSTKGIIPVIAIAPKLWDYSLYHVLAFLWY